MTAAGAASLLPPHRSQAGPPSAAHTGTSCGQRSRPSVFIHLFKPLQQLPGRSHLYAAPGKGAATAAPQLRSPIPPRDSPEAAACRPGTVLLTRRALGFFFPFPLAGSCRCLPVPGSCRGPQCGRAGGHGCGAWSSAIIKQLPGAGERGRCRPCPVAPALSAGRAQTKAPVRCHSRSPRSATAAAGRAAPSCSTRPKDSFWCPRCGHRGVQTPHAFAAGVTQPT